MGYIVQYMTDGNSYQVLIIVGVNNRVIIKVLHYGYKFMGTELTVNVWFEKKCKI